jgi:hypothetical protein
MKVNYLSCTNGIIYTVFGKAVSSNTYLKLHKMLVTLLITKEAMHGYVGVPKAQQE